MLVMRGTVPGHDACRGLLLRAREVQDRRVLVRFGGCTWGEGACVVGDDWSHRPGDSVVPWWRLEERAEWGPV